MHKSKLRLIIPAIAAIVAELMAPSLMGVAHAIPPQFTRAVLRWDTHTALAATGVTTCAVPSSTITVPANTTYHVEIVFPYLSSGNDFVLNTTAANWVTDTNFSGEGQINGLSMTAWPHIASAADSVTAGTANTSGGVVTFPFSFTSGFSLTSGTMYCFHFTSTNTLTNSDAVPSGATIDGTLRVTDDTPTTLEETNYSTSIITDDTITVSAVVPPNFKLSLTGNADTFGTSSRLATNAINVSNGINFRVETNAKGGWIAWVKDTDRGAGVQGLYSATANYTIATGPVGGAGTTVGDGVAEVLPTGGGAEGYLLDADIVTDAAGGCTFPINPNTSVTGTAPDYDGTEVVAGPNTNSGGTLSKVFQPVAECNGTPPATSNGDIVQLVEKVTIAGGTPAGSDYTDVITLVAAGEF